MPVPDDRRHVIPVSGKDSLAAALVQRDREPYRRYEYVFLDVGMELPETYAWLRKVEAHLGVTLARIGRSLEDVMTEQGLLPSHHRRICTKYGKIFPMREYAGDDDVVQYVGLRADEDDRVGMFASAPPSAGCGSLVSKFPLRDAGIDLPGVYALLTARGLVPPNFFWQRLYDAVYARCAGASRRYLDSLPPWRLGHLFAWRSRSNCFMCFYQRLYEWAGLLEHHPGLFARAEEVERRHGSREGSGRLQMAKDFTLRQDGPLSDVRARVKPIFEDRVTKVHRAVVEMRHDPDADAMSQTSCGVYCGK